MSQHEERFVVGYYGRDGYTLMLDVGLVTRERADQFAADDRNCAVAELPDDVLDELEETRRELVVINAQQKALVRRRQKIFEAIEWPEVAEGEAS